MQNRILVGIAGVATVGKSTFAEILEKELASKYKVKQFAFADELKGFLNNHLGVELGVDFFTKDPQLKAILRPIMTNVAEILRNKTKGRYFWEGLSYLIKKKIFDIGLITDLRFCEYAGSDEIDYIHEHGISIYLSREGKSPANEFEKRNDEKLKHQCNVIIRLSDIKDIENYTKDIKTAAKLITEEYTKRIKY